MRATKKVIPTLKACEAITGLLVQEYRATPSNLVLDSSSFAVPGAKVFVTNIAINIHVTTGTNADGNYTIRFLQPGSSATKRLQMHEKINSEFRAEFLNAFNQRWLDAVYTNPADSAFGRATGGNSGGGLVRFQ